MAGLEVLYSSVQSQLKGGEDAIICSLHWAIIQDGLKCIGVGETVPAALDSCTKSELLPAGWNSCQDVYTLLYIHPETKLVYLLKVIKMDASLLTHFMRLDTESVSDMMIDIGQYTTPDIATYHSVYRNIEELQKRFKKEVLSPVLDHKKAKTAAQVGTRSQRGEPTQPDRDPLREPPRRPQASRPPEWGEPANPYPSIGRGDLDPLAGGMGGGMMFDPMRSGPHRGFDPSAGLPGRLPMGAVPPGARFDPFGPDIDISGNPRGGHRPGPDPDHLPPPGFDDMFM